MLVNKSKELLFMQLIHLDKMNALACFSVVTEPRKSPLKLINQNGSQNNIIN